MKWIPLDYTYKDYSDRLSKMWDLDFDDAMFSSLIVMALVLILAIILGIRVRIAYKKKEYLNRPKGFLNLGEMYYDICHNFVLKQMGPQNEKFTGYFMCLFAYLFLAFIWSITGLPSIIDWLAGPLSLSIIMFTLIQFTAIRYQHWHYFHRYIEPFAVFFPINLLTMWTPIISTCMRMFGNCLSGTIIIGLVQWALSKASTAIFSAVSTAGWTSIFLAPIPMGILNLYFSLFSGFVQTLVFATLTALWIAQEVPENSSPAITEAPRAVAQE
jgi:F-type H+-transporting ATPase subunit a